MPEPEIDITKIFANIDAVAAEVTAGIDGVEKTEDAAENVSVSANRSNVENQRIGEELEALKRKKDSLLRRARKSDLPGNVRTRFIQGVKEIFNSVHDQVVGREANQEQINILKNTLQIIDGEDKKLDALIQANGTGETTAGTKSSVDVDEKEKKQVATRKVRGKSTNAEPTSQTPDVDAEKLKTSRRRKSTASSEPTLARKKAVSKKTKAVVADPVIPTVAPPEPKVEPVALDTTETLREKRKKDLLASVPDGAIIEMTSFGGPIRFQRRGDEFFMGEKWEIAGTDLVLEGISAGMIWEIVEEKPEEKKAEPIIPEVPRNGRETLYLKIDRLTKEVNEARAKWVEEDVKRTTLGKKFKSLFGMKQEEKKGDWQEVYENLAQELQQAEVEMMQGDMGAGKVLSEEEMQEGARKLLRYYKIDESVNLINERTQYKAKNQGFSEKIVNSLGDLGRQYNSIPLKRKLIYAGIFAGLTIATTLSGGAAAGALASVVAARRAAAGLGTAVGTEALLESVQGRQKISKGEKEIAEQMRTLEKIGLGEKSEMSLSVLNALLEKDIASLDEKLQNEKRAKTWRKLGAVGFGTLVGSGWLTRVAMEHLGGNEAASFAMNHLGGNTAADWAKEHAQAMFGSPEAVQPPLVSHLPPHPQVAVPEQGVAAGAKLPVTDMKIPIEHLPDLRAGMIDGFVHSDIVVEKGDSVWKIAGGLADKLGLEGAERTHFIDALKDQYGDVQLQADTKINFASHGIDKDFIENALRDTKALTAEQLHSIAANDVKIAEFAGAHPDVTLTDAKVDDILHGNTVADAVSHPSTVPADMPTAAEIPPSGSGTVASEGKAFVEWAKTHPDIQLTDTGADNATIESGAENVSSHVQAPSVEASFTPELQPRVDDWYSQIFRVEDAAQGQDWVLDKGKLLKVPITGVLKDYMNHTSLTGLSSEQINNFGEFMKEVKKTTGSESLMKELLRAKPNATTEDFLKKVAPLIKQGTRLGLYTTTR